MLTKSTQKVFLGRMFSIGFALDRFAIGFTITKYNVDLDLGFVWLAVDF